MDKESQNRKVAQSQGIVFKSTAVTPPQPAVLEEGTHRVPLRSAAKEVVAPVKKDVPIKHFNRRLALLIVAAFCVVALFGFGGFTLYKKYAVRPTSSVQLLAEVGKLVELPSNEVPTIATVSDLEPLKGQEFFVDGQVGDKLLIFSKSKKAILYRPSEKRIIAIGPLKR